MDPHFLFYVAPQHIQNNTVRFPDEEVRHIVKVLRKKPGERVAVTDGTGKRMDVRLVDVDKKQVIGEVLATVEDPPDPERILAMGLIRQRERLEFAVEKAVELGATRILLVRSDHTEKTAVKTQRIDNIMISALKQSRRTQLPQWEICDSFLEVLSVYGNSSTILVAHPDDMESSVKGPDNNRPLLLIVGPEGGFSDSELEQVVDAGAGFVNLAPARLRTETAVCALLSFAAQKM